MAKTVLENLFQKAGSMTAVANFLNITPQAVQQWNSVPTGHAKKLSDQYDIPLNDFFEKNPERKEGAA